MGGDSDSTNSSEGSEKHKAAHSTSSSEGSNESSNEGSGKRKPAYSTQAFTWGHGKNKFWNEAKVHPESGCKMTDTNIIHKDTNPCMKEYHLSMKCLSDMSYQRDLCVHYFNNYRICKVFWMRVVRDRRARGITPMVPPQEEQEAVKQEYMKKKGFEP